MIAIPRAARGSSHPSHSGVIALSPSFLYLAYSMPATSALEAWEFDSSSDLKHIVNVAMERLAPPTFVGHLLSTRGDSLTLQVLEGLPSGDPRSLYYVRGHGAFVLARCEEWPPAQGSARKRILLTLLAFPQPRVGARDPATR